MNEWKKNFRKFGPTWNTWSHGQKFSSHEITNIEPRQLSPLCLRPLLNKNKFYSYDNDKILLLLITLHQQHFDSFERSYKKERTLLQWKRLKNSKRYQIYVPICTFKPSMRMVDQWAKSKAPLEAARCN